MPTRASSVFPTCREEAATRSTRRISTWRQTSSWSFGSPTTTSSRRHSSVMTPRPSCSLRPNRTGRSRSNESSTSCPTCRRGSWRSPSCPLRALTMSARSSARASTGSSSSREAWPTSSATRRLTSKPRLRSEQRAGEAGRSAVALRELLTLVREHFDACLLEPAPCLWIALDHEGDPWCESQHVGRHRFVLVVRHFDDLDPPLGEQLSEPHREQLLVRDDKIVVEWAQQRKQMHDLALAVPVGQVERDDVETGHLREGIGASLIRPVTEAYEQCSLVEPDQIAAFGQGRLVEPRPYPHTRPCEIDAERRGFGTAAGLAGPEQHRPVVHNQCRVVDVDRIRIVLHRRFAEDQLGSGAGEQLAERRMLAREPNWIGLGTPAVLVPQPKVIGLRRPQQDASQRRSHRRTAVQLGFGEGHYPKNALATSYHSGGTVFNSAVASLSGTSTTRSPCSDAICPNLSWCARSAAFSPKRVASTRSRGVGEPPRWTCPSTVTRVSKPVRPSISRASASPTPRCDSRTWPNSSCSPASASSSSS